MTSQHVPALKAAGSASESNNFPQSGIDSDCFHDSAMDELSGGRGHREKIPSAKLKEQAGAAVNTIDKNDKRIHLPVYIAQRDPKLEQEQEELKKTYDHTKTGPNGEKHDFYTLGPQ